MRFFLPPVIVAIAAAASWWSGADPVVAALVLLVAVVASALFGRLTGLLAAGFAAACLSRLFLAGEGELVGDADDVIGLIVFTAIAMVVATLVARERTARRHAGLAEREARLRVGITDSLMRGEPVAEVVASGTAAIADLFNLASCTLAAAGVTATIDRHHNRGRSMTIRSEKASMDLVARGDEPLDDRTVETLTVLVTTLGVLFERADLERSISEARVDAEVNRARAAFFAAAGHNLRTPLASVHTSVSTLLDEQAVLTDADQQELLETIRDETQRLERMVAKVLSQSLVRSGQLAPDRQSVDLAGLVQVAVRRLGPAATRHTIELRVPADIGPVWLDVTMIEQVLLNLLENAVRWAPTGSTITVAARRNRTHITLSVIDRGPGVPPDQEAKVFAEFHRTASKTEAEGTGLGLAIVKAMVEAHDGDVRCVQTPGGGATFVARFPLAGSTLPVHDAPLAERIGVE